MISEMKPSTRKDSYVADELPTKDAIAEHS
jgi:hypothetical protein